MTADLIQNFIGQLPKGMLVQAQRKEGGRAEVWLQPFRNPSLERGRWSAPLFDRFTPEKNSVPSLQEAGLASGPPGFDPACSESLYRRSYPGRT